jgi:3-isopropylmalate dehydrogenase
MAAGDPHAATYRLGALDGDGIGPEVVAAAVRVVDAALAAGGAAGAVIWVPLPVGLAAIASHGSSLPDESLEALATLDGWLLGPHDSAAYPEPHRSVLNPSGTIRKRFQLFANIRPARALPGVPAVAPDTDLVIVRENTEGFYADRSPFRGSGEYMPTPDVAIASAIFTRAGIERVAHAACRLAARRRRHLTIVHKANVLRLTTGLFLDVCRQVAEGYPGLEVDDEHVDAMAALLVRRPADFDVIVTENMFGDILSDLAAELAGSLGAAPSLNASADVAMAQATHGSAPDLAGRGVANPIGEILSAAMLLEWLGARAGDGRLARAAARIDAAVAATVERGTRTADMGGTASTAAFTDAVVAGLAGAGGEGSGPSPA